MFGLLWTGADCFVMEPNDKIENMVSRTPKDFRAAEMKIMFALLGEYLLN